MSQQNVELIRQMYERWDAGESTRDLIDPDMEYVNPPYAVESGVRHGRGALSAVRDVYADFRFEPEEYRDAGDDVVVTGMANGTAASGVQGRWPQGYIWTVREGRVVRFQWFNDPQEALRAAGLEG